MTSSKPNGLQGPRLQYHNTGRLGLPHMDLGWETNTQFITVPNTYTIIVILKFIFYVTGLILKTTS